MLMDAEISPPVNVLPELRVRTNTAIGITLVLGLAALLWCFRLSGPIDLRFDAGVYYLLGTSLATGHGYRIASEPGAPAAIQYPPGLPAIVALHQRLLGTSDPTVVGVWLKRTYAVLFFAFAWLVFELARRMLEGPFGIAAAVLCVVQLNGYFLSNTLFTELPFTLASVGLALTLLSHRLNQRPVARELIAFLLVVVGFSLRTAGVALLCAWVTEALCRKRWRLALVRGVLAAIPFLTWQAYVNSVQGSEEYRHPAYAYQRAPYQFYNVSYAENLALIDPFKPELGHSGIRTLLARVGTNLLLLPLSLGEAASEPRGFWSGIIKTALYPGQKTVGWADAIVVVPLAAVSIVAVAGWILLIRRREWFVASLMLFSVGLVCTTPWPQQFARYLTPLGPFMVIALVLASEAMINRVRKIPRVPLRKAAWFGCALIGGGIVCSHGYAAFNSYRSLARAPVVPVINSNSAWASRRWLYYDNAWADWDRAIDWISQHAPSDAIVSTASPHLCYLMTGRRAVFPPMEVDPIRADALLKQVPISYVIIDELEFIDISRRYARPAVAAEPGEWQLVKSFNKTAIYQRARP